MKKTTQKKQKCTCSIPFECLVRQKKVPIESYTLFDLPWKFLIIMIWSMACKSSTTVTDIY